MYFRFCFKFEWYDFCKLYCYNFCMFVKNRKWCWYVIWLGLHFLSLQKNRLVQFKLILWLFLTKLIVAVQFLNYLVYCNWAESHFFNLNLDIGLGSIKVFLPNTILCLVFFLFFFCFFVFCFFYIIKMGICRYVCPKWLNNIIQKWQVW